MMGVPPAPTSHIAPNPPPPSPSPPCPAFMKQLIDLEVSLLGEASMDISAYREDRFGDAAFSGSRD
jgi:hypothetical protein